MLKKWRVTGIDRSTNKQRVIVIEALDERAATIMAGSSGLAVMSIQNDDAWWRRRMISGAVAIIVAGVAIPLVVLWLAGDIGDHNDRAIGSSAVIQHESPTPSSQDHGDLVDRMLNGQFQKLAVLSLVESGKIIKPLVADHLLKFDYVRYHHVFIRDEFWDAMDVHSKRKLIAVISDYFCNYDEPPSVIINSMTSDQKLGEWIDAAYPLREQAGRSTGVYIYR